MIGQTARIAPDIREPRNGPLPESMGAAACEQEKLLCELEQRLCAAEDQLGGQNVKTGSTSETVPGLVAMCSRNTERLRDALNRLNVVLNFVGV